MLDSATIDTIARGYHNAEKTHELIRPPSAQYEGFTIDDAYAVQRRWVEIKVAEGNMIKGHKIGLTSRAMQRQANITEPDYGALMEDMFYATGCEISECALHQSAVGMRVRLRHRPSAEGPELHDLRCAERDRLRGADSGNRRWAHAPGRSGHRQRRAWNDSIADNAGNAALMVGGRPIKPMDLDLRWVAVLCYRNNVIEESGVAAAVLNHPANGVAWLANKLAPFDIALEPGQFVLGGSFTSVVEARAGDTFHVDYGSFGSISADLFERGSKCPPMIFPHR